MNSNDLRKVQEARKDNIILDILIFRFVCGVFTSAIFWFWGIMIALYILTLVA